MAPSKLSEADKQEIFHRYCNTDETTSTLAKQFGVSVSTISRLLKSQLSPTEYDELVRQKRLSSSRSGETDGNASPLPDAFSAQPPAAPDRSTEPQGRDEADRGVSDETDPAAQEDADPGVPSPEPSPRPVPVASPDRAPVPQPVPLVAELAALANPVPVPAAPDSPTRQPTGTFGLTLDGAGLGADVPPLVASLPITETAAYADEDADAEDSLEARAGRRKRRRSSVGETSPDRRRDRPVSPSPASLSPDPVGLGSSPSFGPSIPPITRALPTPSSPVPDSRDRPSPTPSALTPSGLPLPQPRSGARPTPAAAAQISLWADYPDAEDADNGDAAEENGPMPMESPVPAPALSSGFRAPSRPAAIELDLDDEDEEDDEEPEDPAMAEYLAALGGDDFSPSDEDEDEEDEDEDEDFGEDEDEPLVTVRDRRDNSLLQVLPLTSATLPETGYLVIDRTAELVTCPLSTFDELGQIPASEANNRTLPLFDNHRVARRFSKQNQRVVKVPNTYMIHKTLGCLGAKGITRLLVDGQVYSLDN